MNEQVIGAIGAAALQPSHAMYTAQSLVTQLSTTSVGQTFGSLFASALDSTNQQLIAAESGVQAMATGEASLHDVMIHLEEARLSLQMVSQVRNRLLEAYQDLMRMQI